VPLGPAAAEPAVEEEMGFTEHGQQRMMTGTPVFAWVVAFQRSLLLGRPQSNFGIQAYSV